MKLKSWTYCGFLMQMHLVEGVCSLSLQRMSEAEAEAARNSRLVHAITYQEAIAGIFKPPPPEHRANFMGLFLNCVVAGLLRLHCMASVCRPPSIT